MSNPDWPTKKLGDIVAVMKNAVSTDQLAGRPTVDLYSIAAFDSSRRPEVVAGSTIGSAKYNVPPDCLLVSKLNPRISRVWRVRHATEMGAVCSTEFWPLTPLTSEIDLDYLLWYLRSPLFFEHPLIKPSSTTKSHQRIEQAAFARFVLPVPPLPEQRKIAAILSSVDDTIEATEAVIDQLQVLKGAVVAELLTRGIPGRNPSLKRTRTGEVPERWDVIPLEDVAVVQTGIAKGKYVDGGIEVPYLRVANVQDGYVDLTEMKTLVVEPTALQRYALRLGDVLFTEGGDADKLGRGCVWAGQISPCLHQNHVFAVRPHSGRLLPEFLSVYAASPRGKAYFLDCAKQTTNLASINSTQLKAFPVAVPPLDEQAEIVSVLAAVEERIAAERDSLAGSYRVKSGLMSVLLSGQVRVGLQEQETAA